MPRQKLQEGVLRAELPPSQRGLHPIYVSTEVRDRLIVLSQEWGLPLNVKKKPDLAAVVALLYAEWATQPAPAPQPQEVPEAPSIPWDRLPQMLSDTAGSKILPLKKAEEVIASLREQIEKEGL